jgi:hypothetical protein
MYENTEPWGNLNPTAGLLILNLFLVELYPGTGASARTSSTKLKFSAKC